MSDNAAIQRVLLIAFAVGTLVAVSVVRIEMDPVRPESMRSPPSGSVERRVHLRPPGPSDPSFVGPLPESFTTLRSSYGRPHWQELRNKVDLIAEYHLTTFSGLWCREGGLAFLDTQQIAPAVLALEYLEAPDRLCQRSFVRSDVLIEASVPGLSIGRVLRGRPLSEEVALGNRLRWNGEDYAVLPGSRGSLLAPVREIGAIGWRYQEGCVLTIWQESMFIKRGDTYVNEGNEHLRPERLDEIRRLVLASRPPPWEEDTLWPRDGGSPERLFRLAWIPGPVWIVAGTDCPRTSVDFWYIRCGDESWTAQRGSMSAALLGLIPGN
jgi:hypothetical protein